MNFSQVYCQNEFNQKSKIEIYKITRKINLIMFSIFKKKQNEPKQ